MAVRVLVVDEDEDFCTLVSVALGRRGAEAVQVHSLAELGAYGGADGIDVVFLDNRLPDGDGINHIGKVRVLCPGARIVMVSAMHSICTRALALGADGFLSKPVAMGDLARWLERMA